MAVTDASLKTLERVLTREERRQKFADLGWWVSIPLTIVPAHWLYDGEQRLDARSYAQEAATALRIVRDSGLDVAPLDKIVSEIFILGRFRRVYATNIEAGWPYLSASEVFEFRPTSDRWLAKDHAPRRADDHFARTGWILISASGTVGRTVLATKRLEKFFLTHDLLRVVPGQSPPVGYLYAYLSSWIGQALISKDQYGSAIKHLEPHHLAGVPVPLLPGDEQQAIHDEIMRAYALRDEANGLLDEADEMLHKELGLPRFDESFVPYLPLPLCQQTNRPEIPRPKAFTVHASELNERLDASYHVPVARTVIELLHKGRCAPFRLRKLTDDIRIPPRFKRIYVQKEYGVPFLRPSHLPQMRPYDLGYISRLTKVLDSLVLHKGEVLITTDGTVGRISIVTSRTAGWAGSNNIARVTCGTRNYENGFLAAFLSTPYGFYQLTREIYGGVVDHLNESHLESILVPIPPQNTQAAIGERVVRAYEMKDEATEIEEKAIHRLESALQRRVAG
ncbi:MAG TPA: restriction endonuclease subunit S [Armatimonadetes bacterium]|nr:restriction endonuclease subunit S [Armatimonadota bacterium]